ncbi:hypothetical protein Hdeb2414_s0095g00791791 [Helianthus debilis subsp. tardiflorus]
MPPFKNYVANFIDICNFLRKKVVSFSKIRNFFLNVALDLLMQPLCLMKLH